ncbi:MAG: hypothetical protein ACI9VR_004004 [Cognaticolwellia sp.]
MILLLLACSQPEPPVKRGLNLYAQGLSKLEAGQSAEAAEDFAQARVLDPQSAELLLWQAKAVAEGGDLKGAIALVDQAVVLRPGMVEAWYNRACYRARSGDVAGASLDLQQALRSPDLDRLLVAQDTDLAILRADPGNADWIPLPRLGLSLKVPDQPFFLGSEIELVIGIDQGADQGLTLRMISPLSPLLRPVAWIEEGWAETPGHRRLRLRLKVQGAGRAELGPFVVSASGLTGEIPAQSVSLLAPESHLSPSESWTGSMRLPSELLQAVPGAQRLEGEWVLVSYAPGDRVEWAAGEQVTLEVREDGVLQALGKMGRLPEGETLSIKRGQEVLWQGSP